MNLFLLWLFIILLAFSAYLAYLWWHPRQRPRFQVRLTVLFLLFTLLPTVPLIFIVSTLATDTADVLLVPEVESALTQSLTALKLQFEDTATRFVQATPSEQVSPELLARWNFDSYFLWQSTEDSTRLLIAVTRDTSAFAKSETFSPKENWSQRGSSLEILRDGRALCRVWQPRASNEMALVEFRLAPEVLAAKEQVTRTLRIYNTLSLIKERTLQDQIIWSAAIVFVAALSLLAVLVARKRARILSRPLEELIAVTNKVAAGDLHIQSEAQAQDEIRQLREAFNAMIRALRVNSEKLLVAERLAAWREVARQVSHEIKNPLTPIQLALYRLKQRLPEAMAAQEAVGESLHAIEEELASFKHLAEEFSGFARLPAAELKPEDLNDLVQSTARLYETEAQIELRLAPRLPILLLDREQIKRLLNNLIKNAREACTSAPSVIRITTKHEHDGAQLEIADNGPGLSASARAHLFEPNFTTKRGGSGLGLVMVKRIVEEHGATITVQSEEGQGTRFMIDFKFGNTTLLGDEYRAHKS